MFVLVVTGKKELADDKAVLLSNSHHGLCLLKLEAGCTVSARLGGKCSIVCVCVCSVECLPWTLFDYQYTCVKTMCTLSRWQRVVV